MFRGLHLRLTLLYLIAALALIALVAFGTYLLLNRYFETTTDLALQYRMAQEFTSIGMPLPTELAAAQQTWSASRNQAVSSAAAQPTENSSAPHDEAEEGSSNSSGAQAPRSEETYDGELAAIFVLPLNASGQLLSNPNTFQPPLVSDQAAVNSALTQGSDLRTVRLDDGTRVRLLTYRVQGSDGSAVVQVGRTLADQDRVLNQLLIGLVALGGLSAVLLGLGSWWLAGRSLEPAQQAWERQQAFVANASHELRTPLTLMRASAEVALRGLPAEDADRQMLLKDVLQETDHMNHLVEDLLLLSRLDGGRLQLERSVIPLNDLLADVQRQVGRIADERGIQLITRPIAGSVLGDPTRLRQVLLILLDNALRHTPAAGSIELSARVQGRQTQIDVQDSGSGIAPEHLPHVFERFYRADNTPHAESTGSGLGLAIAKGLIEAQGGQISIHSRAGQGTCVSLVLPTAT